MMMTPRGRVVRPLWPTKCTQTPGPGWQRELCEAAVRRSQEETGMDQGDSACPDSHILTNWPCLLNVTRTFICYIGYFKYRHKYLVYFTQLFKTDQ